MRRVQDTCNPGRRRHYPQPAAIQTSALVLSESSNEESSNSNATWGWCLDSNDQKRAEQVAQSQIIVRSCGGPSDQPGVGSGGGPKVLGDPQVQASDLVCTDNEGSSSESKDSLD